jgi:hypothetical protein
MTELDQRLREAGARLRDTAPTPAATEAAFRSLDDVQLDSPSGRSRRWIVGPAVVLAAAAAIVGVIVLTRPEQSAVVPADTVPNTTSTIVEETGLLDGITLETSNEDFDSDGGACLTLSTPTDTATGCAPGPLMRSAFGQPLWLRLGDTPYWLFPSGPGGSGDPELLPAENTPPACSTEMVQPGVLVEIAGCDGVYPGIIGVLPATPADEVAWALVSADSGAAGTDLALVTASADAGARVFRSQECTIVTARNNAVRESCGGASSFLAGSTEAPLVVSTDTGTIDQLDATTTLAVNGCGALTAGELVSLLPQHGVADFLLCGGDMAAVRVAPTMTDPRFAETAWDVLRHDADGSWAVAASEVDYTCREGVAAEACAALGIFDLAGSPPFPSAASIAAFDQAMAGVATLPGRSADEEVAPFVQPAADLPALADAIAAAMLAAQGGDGRAEVVAGASSPIIIRRSNLDDSVTETVFVLTAGPTGSGEVTVFSRGNRAIDICGRGTATGDGVTVCL